MMRDSQDEARRYLLGRLSEDEAERLERAYLGDESRADDIAAAESDLVDAYVAGVLPPSDREAFEAHYLASPVHRDRVATARLLRRAAGAATPRRVAAAWIGLLATAAGVAGLVLWRSRPAEQPPAQIASAPSPTPTAPALEAPAPAPGAAAPAPKRAVTLALAAVRVRGGDLGSPELRLPPDADEVALELGGGADASAGGSLSFTVRTVEGAEVARGRLERRAGTLGVARLRAARLRPDDYIVAVSSADEPAAAQYVFRVVR
jgi:hypothetical protein